MTTELTTTLIATAVIGGYLLGSIPFGVIVMRSAGAGDPRAIGSGNIGATNVLRSGRKGLAALTLLGDGGKGALAVLAAFLATRDRGLPAQALLTALAGGAHHDHPERDRAQQVAARQGGPDLDVAQAFEHARFPRLSAVLARPERSGNSEIA